MMYGALTDKGMVRQANEDCFRIINRTDALPWIFMVADGLGGHNSGEIASSMAVDYLERYINDNAHEFNTAELLSQAISTAVSGVNTHIYSSASQQENFNGMGTTLTLAIVIKDMLYIGHVGDSRLYIIENGNIKKLTQDHSYIEELLKNGSITKEEAINHPRKNIITRAIGGDNTIEVDIYRYKLEYPCYLLLCTDGLTNMLSDEEIHETVINAENPQAACENLTSKANDMGGLDNITVIVVNPEEKSHI